MKKMKKKIQMSTIIIHDCFYYSFCVKYFPNGSCAIVDPTPETRAAHQLQILSSYKKAYDANKEDIADNHKRQRVAAPC